jgi:hypothetical protein
VGVSSRHGSFAIGVQSAKGTPAADPVVKMFLSGAPSIGPDKQRERYSMTDDNRDLGASFTSGIFISGDVPIYCHPSLMSLLSWLVLGANADAGTTPNFTHTATPAADVPWITCWRMVAGVIVEKYVDCKLTGFAVEGAAGQPLGATLSIIGCTSTFEAADTDVDAATDAGLLYMEGAGLISIDGSARKCHRVSIGVQNNHSGYQADGYTYDDVDPGGREFSFSFATRFAGPTAFPSYRTFFYGSDVGTTLSPAVATAAVDVIFRRNANLEWRVQFPSVTYQPFQVQPDPGGDPLEYEVACFVERPGSGEIATFTTKDQKATPDEPPA